ncbi:UNKNOWN [Stylonychia lemnae]|uniref:Uncharacterized protein n=1 Tax=Stylonychia lemnae TaxID=5949 RepID=A0A078AFM3_STYLE|nr:UNKNOWN [Stylonychia lemnae]|eukprot:CDW81039.1 UNKNOWN [Stylonychia lemnae]
MKVFVKIKDPFQTRDFMQSFTKSKPINLMLQKEIRDLKKSEVLMELATIHKQPNVTVQNHLRRKSLHSRNASDTTLKQLSTMKHQISKQSSNNAVTDVKTEQSQNMLNGIAVGNAIYSPYSFYAKHQPLSPSFLQNIQSVSQIDPSQHHSIHIKNEDQLQHNLYQSVQLSTQVKPFLRDSISNKKSNFYRVVKINGGGEISQTTEQKSQTIFKSKSQQTLIRNQQNFQRLRSSKQPRQDYQFEKRLNLNLSKISIGGDKFQDSQNIRIGKNLISGKEQNYFKIQTDLNYRGYENKTPLSKLLKIRQDNDKIKPHEKEDEVECRFLVKSPSHLKNLISEKFVQMQTKKHSPSKSEIADSKNNSMLQSSPSRAHSPQKKKEIERVLEISKKAKYINKLSRVEQKFLTKFIKALNQQGSPEKEEEVESDESKLEQNPFMNKVMEEKLRRQAEMIQLLSSEIENSHDLVQKKLKKQPPKPQQNMMNKFAMKLIVNMRRLSNEFDPENKLQKMIQQKEGGEKVKVFKKNYAQNLFGNKDNTDLDQIEKRYLSWESRIGNEKDIQLQIKPYDMLGKMISNPKPIDTTAIPQVKKLLNRFQNRQSHINNEKMKMIKIQQNNFGVAERKIFSAQNTQRDQTKEEPIQISLMKKYEGNIDLINMIKHKKIRDVYKVLKKGEQDVMFQRDSIGMTPFHWACKRKDKIAAQLLLNFDSPIDEKDMFGRKPIDIARYQEKDSIIRVRLLINYQKFR